MACPGVSGCVAWPGTAAAICGRPKQMRAAAVDILGLTFDYTKTPGLVVVIDSLADQGRADEGEALLAERGMDGELTPTLFSRAAIAVARSTARGCGR